MKCCALARLYLESVSVRVSYLRIQLLFLLGILKSIFSSTLFPSITISLSPDVLILPISQVILVIDCNVCYNMLNSFLARQFVKLWF